MRYGMPFLLQLNSIEENAALCKELGLDFLELNMSFPACGSEQLSAERLRKMKQAYGIDFTIHLDELLQPCAFEKNVREAYVSQAVNAIESARETGCPVVNLHWEQGVHVTLPNKIIYLNDAYKTEYLHNTDMFRNACRDASKGQVKVCIENTSGWRDFQQQAIQHLLEADCFGLTLDIGHEATTKEITDTSFYHLHKDRLCHMHAHDAVDGQCHLPFGSGNIDLIAKLNEAKEAEATVVLQVKTAAALRESVVWLKKHYSIH